ncbi:small ribosomal subunit Rsm22 family protein [Streptomyces hoynatensis]|uniref:rRNA methyltransferase n=1 Tax=Streptomyces hoynatensis TaxID=1141874 RepID=A0A3A9ZCM2_9ACTN|nr:small ribosomal subunit Rsm22 family protein [Streptomyces hoynatensis]RKN46000.1 rRNA methyltransferase [Streptomyces hoynatensis]
MTSTSDHLRAALDGLLDGLPTRQAAAAVDRLISGYRSRAGGPAPALRNRADAVAYAAYRMPATHEALAAALRELAAALPGWAPASHLDLGGGTGAAAWAAAGVWPGQRHTLVLDAAAPALELGRELAGRAAEPAVRAAQWRQERLGERPGLPEADLITVSYLLGELPEAVGQAVVEAVAGAASAAGAVVLVEPGSPEGHRRIGAARDRLLAAGLRLLAPCPHERACPLAEGDWCHFAARVARSAVHRRVKGGVLPYEDEKFAYLVATRLPAAAREGDGRAAARVLRRPLLRKGQVLLDLCTPEGTLRRETVTRRDPAPYRAARDTGWGDTWG